MHIILRNSCKFSNRPPKFDSNKNYYDILKVQFGSSKSVIRLAYLGLAKKYHPDVNPKEKQYFIVIQEAYQILSNQQDKRQYDQFFKENFGSASKKQYYSQSNGSNGRPNQSAYQYTQSRYQYNKKADEFKGQQKSYDYPYEIDLKKQRQKWTKQFYEQFGFQKKQPIPAPKKKIKTQLDQQYQKMQYTFSNKNPYSPSYKQKYYTNTTTGFSQLWQDLKNKLKK